MIKYFDWVNFLGIAAFTLFVSTIIYVSATDGQRCTDRWKEAHLNAKRGPGGVCLVELKPDFWIPESRIKFQ